MILRCAVLTLLVGIGTVASGQGPVTQAPAVPAPSASPSPTPSPDLPDAPSTSTQVRPPAIPTGPVAVIDTTMGRMTCKLFDKEAPLASANFIGLAEGSREWIDPDTQKKVKGKPFYAGVTFHRVIPGFMIQGGDRLGTGIGDAGYFFQDEIDPALQFDVPGRLAMANAGSGPTGSGTNGSQFFITEAPVPELNGKHTIFGQCDAHSLAVETLIAHVDRDANDKPTTPVVINRITIVREGQPTPVEPVAPAASPTPATPK